VAAIFRLLKGSAFGPDEIGRMAEAYERALRVLDIPERNSPVTEVLARRIIEVAQTGEKDPVRMCARALKQLRQPKGTAYPRIENSGLPPDKIAAVSTAFEEMCRMLQLSPTEDPLRDIVADVVIDCFKRGMTDPREMLSCAQYELTRGRP
jgi:uncharacterized membrane-anchored protein